MWGYGPFGGYGSGLGIFDLLFMIAFWALIISGIVALVRYITGQSREDRRQFILKLRFSSQLAAKIPLDSFGLLKVNPE